MPNYVFGQTKYQPKYLRENNGAFRALTSYVSESGWIEFRPGAEPVEPDAFFKRFGETIGLGNEYEMRLVSDETDFKEIRHQKYQLYYQNIRVEHVQYYLHSKHKRLQIADGRVVENLNVDVSKPIAEKQAMEVALADQKWAINQHKSSEKLPKGELLIARIGSEFVRESFQFCYAFDVTSDDLANSKEKFAEPFRIYVDAFSGKVLKRYPLSQKCFHAEHSLPGKQGLNLITAPQHGGFLNSGTAPMTASTFTPLWGGRYGGSQSFETEQSGNQFRLSHQNGVLITRRDVNGGGFWSNNLEVLNANTNWGASFQNATTAHWLTQRVHTFIRGFSPDQNGYNRQGAYPRILVDLGGVNPRIDARWSSNLNQITFGFVPNPTPNFGQFVVNPSRSFVAADILGHEYMHAVTEFSVPGGLTYFGESGALNESIYDIFGTAFERYLFPNNWNWDVGEDAFQARDMANPRRAFPPFLPINGQPVTYLDTNNGWQNTSNTDNFGGVHVNSGVMNKWFHTLCTGQGPGGNNINAISFKDATDIVYRTLRFYLQSASGYPNMRDATSAAARDLFGGCSPQQKAVVAAWGTAGLPSNNSCDPDCNFLPFANSINTGCGQGIMLSASCNGGAGNSCLNTLYSFAGPNVPFNQGGNTINITAPSSPGNYQYNVSLSKPGCFSPTRTFNVNVNCAPPSTCDFSGGPRYVGTWSNLTVQIRNINGQNVVVTAITGGAADKYYPRGDNFWTTFAGNGFNVDPNAANLQNCLNAGSSEWYGLSKPPSLNPPPGYSQGQEADGSIFFTNGGNPPNPCDFSQPRNVGTWNDKPVQIRQYANGKRVLVTVENGSNDKHFPRGDNFWDNFTKNADAEQYRGCLNGGDTEWFGLSFPPGVTPPGGYQQGTAPDGATFFSTNGLRKAAPEAEPTLESVALVKVRPNPALDEITVTYTLVKAGSVPLRILDIQGRVLHQQKLTGVAGTNEQTVNVSALTTGLYAVEVVLNQQRIVHKLMKQ